MKTKIVITIILSILILASCQESGDLNQIENNQKKKITVENIGEIHNELLSACYTMQARGAIVTTPTDMASCFDVFKTELIGSGKYDISTQEAELCESSINDFQEIRSLKIDSTFYESSLGLVLDKIEANNGICDEVKKVIYEITDSNCTLSVAELSSLAQRYQNYLGGEYLVVYSNIFKSSSEYWHPVSTRSSNSRKVIAADCVGGLLGLTCCGAMSVIWGAAFSYSLDKCLEPYTVTIRPDNPIYINSNDSVVWTATIDGNN